MAKKLTKGEVKGLVDKAVDAPVDRCLTEAELKCLLRALKDRANLLQTVKDSLYLVSDQTKVRDFLQKELFAVMDLQDVLVEVWAGKCRLTTFIGGKKKRR